MKTCQLAIIGAGPAGLAAAISAFENGLRDILIIERDHDLGGILNQCIHSGFGLHYFNEELTGPEYAEKFINMLNDTSATVLCDTMVLDIGTDKIIHAVSKRSGYMEILPQSIILAMGCRERTRGAIAIPGTRCSGIFTAGTAQRYININGYMVGKRVVILGSGDIGLIMARRMSLEGAQVLACIEVMPYSSGLNRNIVQCLDDFNIPLYLKHTVTDIQGKNRLEKVVVSEVDEHRNPIFGTEITFECDTLLLSVGLIPENELSRQAGIVLDSRTNGPVVYENMETSIPGIFACGNVVHVHDLVDYVTKESQKSGKSAANYVLNNLCSDKEILSLNTGDFVSYTVPQHIHINKISDNLEITLRVNRTFAKSRIVLKIGNNIIASFKRSYMTPGEMEHITVPKSMLSNVSGIPITVDCEEVDV